MYDFGGRYLAISLDHRDSIVHLLQSNRRSAAYALVRSVYEALLRGLWVFSAATDDAIGNLEKGITPGMERVVKELSSAERSPIFLRSKQFGWTNLSDFAHGGSRQLSYWTSDDGLGANHPDEGVLRILLLVDFYGLLASGALLDAGNQPMDALLPHSQLLMVRAKAFGSIGTGRPERLKHS